MGKIHKKMWRLPYFIACGVLVLGCAGPLFAHILPDPVSLDSQIEIDPVTGHLLIEPGKLDSRMGMSESASLPKGATGLSVIRGPYLQLGTPTSIIVRWRTSQPTDSRVRYGTEPVSLTSATGNIISTTDHAVLVNSLSPETRYYYTVGNATASLAGATDSFSFVTSPPTGIAKPTRIWVLGDSGTATFAAEWVRDAFYDFNGGPRPDLWLMLGDDAYPSGTDLQYQRAVFDMYPQTLHSSVLWPTLGNHDGISSFSDTESGPYYDIFSLPREGEAGGLPSGTEAYYSFDYANLHFVCLDSFHSDRSTDGAMLSWLAADVAATTQEWIIAFWHHPPYSKGNHDSDLEGRLIDMRENALPVLEAAGVDLVLSGHSHSYERSYLIDGHYGDSESLLQEMILDAGNGRIGGNGPYLKPPGKNPHEGAVYAVAGSSGQTSQGSLDHPVMFYNLRTLGSMVMDIHGSRLEAGFVDSEGVLRDFFAIDKNEGPSNVRMWGLY